MGPERNKLTKLMQIFSSSFFFLGGGGREESKKYMYVQLIRILLNINNKRFSSLSPTKNVMSGEK